MRKLQHSLRTSKRMAAITAVAIVAVIAGTGTVLADEGGWFSGNDNAWPYNATGPAPVLAAVGDISCQPGTKVENEKKTDVCDLGTGSTVRDQAQNATSTSVEAIHPAMVAVLGDLQYQNGYYSDFENSYDKYWGAFKFLQRPAPGNHEFYDNHGQTGVRGVGYYDYFNGIQHKAADGSEIDQNVVNSTGTTVATEPTPLPAGQAGTTGQGWYSYNLGHWHLVSLNVECEQMPGGCDPNGSWFASETKWLAQDLDQNHSACTAIYWHQPTFSATQTTVPFNQGSADGEAADAWWQLAYQHHVTLILNGHDHVYARFAPMDPAGNADPKGPREFIVGTGGESLDVVNPATPNLQDYEDTMYGVGKFTLGDGWYKWDFENAPNGPVPSTGPTSFSDTGIGACQGNDQGDQGNGRGNNSQS
jgi:hypothetical protein